MKSRMAGLPPFFIEAIKTGGLCLQSARAYSHCYFQTMSSSDSEVLVRVNGVSKKFCRDLKKSLWYGLKDVASELLPFSSNQEQSAKNQVPGLRPGEFWANKDVSFELRRGECLGLIGRNGAGKTTLLKMLNGLIKPDTGSIEMQGRVGALIALGAGFNPILTGRENIYVNGSILGLSKEEIDEKMEDIIEFAEIPDFIDSPVQSYSSGMQVRLGFAVATALEPDILILDEVLAVGDASFRNKCYNRISKLRKKAAVIFVSHSMEQISIICDMTLVMQNGSVVQFGTTAEGINCYESLNQELSMDGDSAFESMHAPVTSFSFQIDESVQHGGYARMRAIIECQTPVIKAVLRVVIYNSVHSLIAEWNSHRIGQEINLEKGSNEIALQIGPLPLKTGLYRLGIALSDSTGVLMLIWSYRAHSVKVHGFTGVGPDVALGMRADIR